VVYIRGSFTAANAARTRAYGSRDAYKVLKVDNSGHSTGSVTVPAVMPMTGLYYVSVSASVANPETIVACGNLAPPAR
jgi:hypothetical protein